MSVNIILILAASGLIATSATDKVRPTEALPKTEVNAAPSHNEPAGRNHPVGTEWAREKFYHNASHALEHLPHPNPHACGSHGVAISPC
ncbi:MULTISPECIES: hypothetical protein [unclassified Novosphingobium]|uniref:hypothetical protein n=1 Tax=unclassified Novosphingobium TaxID=2644732 RepID=UPI0014452D04|nr:MULTISPECIES: hypothetical protein [unclassified Novosphingobium]MBN9145216.1 hypothetical protein [Novosphingobium sp.]MDR6709594.1 hypothetical protein [Novosphingobium sp. 1748]NKI99084.1 hypothetical protein [Novosphingobium sp. SG707]